MKKEPLMTIKDVAKRLNISPSTIRNKITHKDWDSIPKPTVKIGRSWRWEASHVEAFIRGEREHFKTADKNAVPADFAEYV